MTVVKPAGLDQPSRPAYAELKAEVRGWENDWAPDQASLHPTTLLCVQEPTSIV